MMNNPKLAVKRSTTSQSCTQISLNLSECSQFEWTLSESIDSYERSFYYSEPSYENGFDAKFQPIEHNQMPYISIGNDGLTARMDPHKETLEFWTNLEQLARQLSENVVANNRDEL